MRIARRGSSLSPPWRVAWPALTGRTRHARLLIACAARGACRAGRAGSSSTSRRPTCRAAWQTRRPRCAAPGESSGAVGRVRGAGCASGGGRRGQAACTLRTYLVGRMPEVVRVDSVGGVVDVERRDDHGLRAGQRQRIAEACSGGRVRWQLRAPCGCSSARMCATVEAGRPREAARPVAHRRCRCKTRRPSPSRRVPRTPLPINF